MEVYFVVASSPDPAVLPLSSGFGVLPPDLVDRNCRLSSRKEIVMPEMDDLIAKATTEANEAFGRLGKVLEEASQREGMIKVADIARQAGLEIDDSVLKELQIDPIIPVHPWLPWHYWFPWRPLWCWWWHRRYSWYRCCPWWWHRCHWYPHHW